MVVAAAGRLVDVRVLVVGARVFGAARVARQRIVGVLVVGAPVFRADGMARQRVVGVVAGDALALTVAVAARLVDVARLGGARQPVAGVGVLEARVAHARAAVPAGVGAAVAAHARRRLVHGGDQGQPRAASLLGSKAGVVSLTSNLAMMWAKHNINVNCILRGLIATEELKATASFRRPWTRTARRCRRDMRMDGARAAVGPPSETCRVEIGQGAPSATRNVTVVTATLATDSLGTASSAASDRSTTRS